MSNLSGFVKRLRDIMRNDAGINGDAQRIEQIAWMLFLKVYDAKEKDWSFDDGKYVSIIPEECRWENWAHDDKSGKAITGEQLLDFVNNTLFPILKGKDIKDSNGKVLIKGIVVDANTPIKKSIVHATFADANNYMKDGVLLRQVINVIDDIDFGDYAESHAFGEIYETILKELQSAGSAGEFYTPRAVTDFMAKMIQPKIGETMADFACGTGGFITSWLKELRKHITNTTDAEKCNNSAYGIEKKPFPYILGVTNMLLHDWDNPRIYHKNSLDYNVLDYTVDDQFDVILMNPPYGGNEKADVKMHFPDDLASSETADLFMAVIMYRLKQNGRAAVVISDGFLNGTDNVKVTLKRKLLSEFNLHTIIRMPRSVFSPYTPIATNILFFDHTGPTKDTWVYRLDMPKGYKHFSKTKPMKVEHFNPALEWWHNRREIKEDGFDKAKCYTVQQLTEDTGFVWKLCSYPHFEDEILSPVELIHQYQEERATLNAIADQAVYQIADILQGHPVAPTNVNQTHVLSRLAELDLRFANDMTKSVLQLAIQGKLVEQHPEEGTGEELYRQIQQEKQRLIRAGAIKKEKTLPEITEEEIPFEIPEQWKWVRIAEVTTLNPKNSLPDDQEVSFIPMALVDDGYRNHHTSECRIWKSVKKDFTHFTNGDIGVAKITPCFQNRKSVIFAGLINGYGAGTTELSIVRCLDRLMYTPYLLWFFKTAYFIDNGVKSFTGTAGQQRIRKDYLATCLLPLPPLAEQKRIVAKLEELLPLCERLK